MPKKNEVVEGADGKPIAVPTGKGRGPSKVVFASGETSDGISLRAQFVDGQNSEMMLPAALLNAAAAFGVAAKFKSLGGDTLEEVKANVAELIKQLESGVWPAPKRAGRKGSAAKVDDLAQAIATVKGQTLEAVNAWLATKDRAFKMKLRSNPEVAAELLKMRAAVPKEGDEDTFAGL